MVRVNCCSSLMRSFFKISFHQISQSLVLLIVFVLALNVQEVHSVKMRLFYEVVKFKVTHFILMINHELFQNVTCLDGHQQYFSRQRFFQRNQDVRLVKVSYSSWKRSFFRISYH